MKKTNFLGLKKPDAEDYFNIEDFNENAEIIDEKVKQLITNPNTVETIYSETFDATQSVTRTLDVDLFTYKRLLVVYTFTNEISSGVAYVTAKAGTCKLGSDGHSSISNGSGMIYFDNSSPIKLRSSSLPGYGYAMVNFIEPTYIADTGEGKTFSLSSGKGTVLITGFIIYGERSALLD